VSIGFFDAIREGNRYEVERQLIVDPSLVHTREDGLSPILVAAYHGQAEIASFLADKTIVLTIFEAAATGKINHVIRLLARDPQLVNAYAEDGFQALGLACFFGHYRGADPNVREQGGFTPLHAAAQNDDLDTVRLLLLGGADLTLKNQDGKTALDVAMDAGNEKASALLGEGVTKRFKRRDE
jgi:hypothetical protein